MNLVVDPEYSKLVSEIRSLWTTISSEISRAYGFSPDACPESIQIVEDESSESALGGWLDDDSLFVSLDTVQGRIPLRGLIAKACFRSALPEAGICEEFADDTSTEFARQMLETCEEKEWVRRWAVQSPRRAISTVQVYNPSAFFPLLYRLIGSDALQDMINEVMVMLKYGLTLNFEDYLDFIKNRFRRFSARLDSTELKMVKRLLQRSSPTYVDLAAEVGVSPEWLSKKISRLRQKGILRKFDRVPFSRIGIRMFHLLISYETDHNEPFEFVSRCPFLYSYQKVLTGRWDALATFSIPDNVRSMRSLQTFTDAVNKWGVDTTLSEIASSGTVDCFDYYDVDKGGWSIPWELMEVQVRKIHNENLADAFPRVDRPASRIRCHLDRLDLQILEEVRRGHSSVGRVRNALRVGQQKVASRLKRLREEGLIVPTWEAHSIGLIEHLFVTTDDVGAGRTVTAWAQRLPRCIISFDVDRRLSLIAKLPHGGGYGLTRALSSLSHLISIGILDTNIYGGWGFPSELWDSNEQRWLFPEHRVADWFETLR